MRTSATHSDESLVPFDNGSLQSKNDQTKAKVLAQEVYEFYIYEIAISIGCFRRWSCYDSGINDLMEWILSSENFQTRRNSESAEGIAEISNQLLSLIEEIQLRLDVTLIKASIRTLLRASQPRKEKLVAFIDHSLKEVAGKQDAIDTLKSDLMIEGIELGYPIPVMPSPTNEMIEAITQQSVSPVKTLSSMETLKQLAKRLNDGDLTFRKSAFELEVRLEVAKQVVAGGMNEQDPIVLSQLEQGVSAGLLSFGLQARTNGWYQDDNGELFIDLRNSSISESSSSIDWS
ncbi:MAG: hypothetical protein AB8A46_01000 [Prochlorococcus sp.]|nr:hypothetical protein [Prochlorococcus sp.]CAI8159882.1 MAG: Uncharacterised protein [Prochlorococcus marinus str. MIT 9215]